MPESTWDFNSHERPEKVHLTPRPSEAVKLTAGNASVSVRAFCEQISKDAQEEVRRILGKAELSAARRGEEAEKEAVQAARQIHQAAQGQVKSVEARTMAGVSLDMRKTILRVQGEIVEEVLARVRASLKEMRGTKQYADSLKQLSVEGIIALGEEKCILAPGLEDRRFFTPQFLREIEQLVARTGGRKAELTISDDILPDGGGVRVYSTKRTVLFDNTIDARMERLADELRAIVAREVFAEKGKHEEAGTQRQNAAAPGASGQAPQKKT